MDLKVLMKLPVKNVMKFCKTHQVRAKSVTMKIYQLDSLRNGVILIRFSTNILF